jgi:translation initiation factor IF-3
VEIDKINRQRKFVRLNRQITCPTVRLKQDNEYFGVVPIQQALDLAYQAGVDLVETVPNAAPPICEIMDYSKFRYQEQQKQKDQQSKQKSAAPKEIRLRPVSGDHDVDTKINQFKKFLAEKHPVSVNIMFKSREMMFKDNGWQIMNRILIAIAEIGQPMNAPKFEGTRLSVRLVPKACPDAKVSGS